MEMAVIDASNLVFGRLASLVAERALKGEQIDIVNAEQCVIIGHKKPVIERYRKRLGMRGKANPEMGPKYSKTPDKIMRRAIRGMVPRERERGKKALKRVRIYIGVPRKLEGKETETIKIASYNGKEEALRLGEISRALGWKWSM